MIGGSSMEGAYFYFFSWLGWIFVTFFMKKSKARLVYAAVLLFTIMISQTVVTFGEFRIWIGAFFLLVIGIIGISRLSMLTKLYYAVCSTIVGMVYAIVHLVELYDPVWIIINHTWFLSILLAYISYVLIRLPEERILVLCVGVVQGEILVTAVLEPYGFHNEFGSMLFLDAVACAVFLLCVLSAILKGLAFVEPFKQKQVRERQG